MGKKSGLYEKNRFINFFTFFLMIVLLTSTQPLQSQENDEIPLFFDVTFVSWNKQQGEIQIAEEFKKIGINVEFDIVDTGIFFDRRQAEIGGVQPLYADGGFDLLILKYFDYVFEYLGQFYEIDLRSDDNKQNPDAGNYYNPEYDQLHDDLLAEVDQDKRLILQDNIFDILYNDLPRIPIAQLSNRVIYNSELNITEIDINKLSWSAAISSIADLNVNNKDTLNIVYPFTPGTTATFNDCRCNAHAQLFMNLIFQGLYERDPLDFTKWVPMIAKDLPTWNEDGTIATVTLRDDVYFADGVNLTSFDVVESYQTYLTPLPAVKGNQNYYELTKFFTNDSIIAIDDYTVKFTFNQPYAYPFSILSKKILPIHTYGPSENQTLPATMNPNFAMLFDIITKGRSPYALGSGPYTPINASIDFGFEFLEATGNYWKSDVQTKNLRFFKEIDIQDSLDKVNSGEIDFIVGRIANISRQQINAEQFVNYYDIPTSWMQTIIVNFDHPVFGTGIDTPLGKTNPNEATNAARYVRQAMSYVIPRQKIIEEEFDGAAIPAALNVPNFVDGYNNDLQPYQFNITKARELMEMAGYEYPKEAIQSSITTITSIDRSTNEDTSFPFSFSLIILPIILYGYIFKQRRKYVE